MGPQETLFKLVGGGGRSFLVQPSSKPPSSKKRPSYIFIIMTEEGEKDLFTGEFIFRWRRLAGFWSLGMEIEEGVTYRTGQGGFPEFSHIRGLELGT